MRTAEETDETELVPETAKQKLSLEKATRIYEDAKRDYDKADNVTAWILFYSDLLPAALLVEQTKVEQEKT